MSWLEVAPAPSLGGSLSAQLAVLLFAALLGGGIFTGLGNFIKARSTSRQVRLDTDPNSPRVAIGGAETAVKMMEITLRSLQGENKRQAHRIDELEASVKSRDDHIENQDKEIDELKESVRVLNARLGIATT
jgi:uncharacterized protein HemX